MGRSFQIINNGVVTGYECEFGHKHSCAQEAMSCDPNDRAKLDTDAKKQAEAQRQQQILDDPNFQAAVTAAKKLGAPDDDTAKAVVLKNGCSDVLAAAAAQSKLGIPKVKPAKPADPPKTT